MNEYEPWKETNETELEYFKRKFLEVTTIEEKHSENAVYLAKYLEFLEFQFMMCFASLKRIKLSTNVFAARTIARTAVEKTEKHAKELAKDTK